MQGLTVEPWSNCASAPGGNNCCGATDCRTDSRNSYYSWIDANSGYSAAGYGEPNSRDRSTNSWHSDSNSGNRDPRNDNSRGHSHESNSGNYSNNSDSGNNSDTANS